MTQKIDILSDEYLVPGFDNLAYAEPPYAEPPNTRVISCSLFDIFAAKPCNTGSPLKHVPAAGRHGCHRERAGGSAITQRRPA